MSHVTATDKKFIIYNGEEITNNHNVKKIILSFLQ
jgi:hypothetical protein